MSVNKNAFIEIKDITNNVVKLQSDKSLQKIIQDHKDFENRMKSIFESEFVKNNFRK